AGAALAVSGLLAGVTVAGDGDKREIAFGGVVQVSGLQETGRAAAARAKKKKKPVITHYQSKDFVTVPGNIGYLYEMKCPKGQKPIGGGAQTEQDLVIGNLSRANPNTGKVKKASYWVALDNLAPDARDARLEIVCAK